MPNYLHRTTKQYQESVSTIDLAESVANYIEDPDLSAVSGFSSKYWVITGDVVTLMDQTARDAVDVAEETARLDGIADQIDAAQTVLRAFAEVVLDEINTLRSQHSLADRTLAQLKTALRGKL